MASRLVCSFHRSAVTHGVASRMMINALRGDMLHAILYARYADYGSRQVRPIRVKMLLRTPYGRVGMSFKNLQRLASRSLGL